MTESVSNQPFRLRKRRANCLLTLPFNFCILSKAFSESAFKTSLPHAQQPPPTISDVARQWDDACPGGKSRSSPPRHAARVLASKRTNTIALGLSEISPAFFPPMLRGIEAGAYEAGDDLLIHSTKKQGPSRRPLGERNSDGLLIFTDSLDRRELHHLHNMNFPMMLLHQTPPDLLHIPAIAVENKHSAVMLVNHLIEVHGRRRIVFLQGPEGHEDSDWRERGDRGALEAHNLPFHPGLAAPVGFTVPIIIAFFFARKTFLQGMKLTGSKE